MLDVQTDLKSKYLKSALIPSDLIEFADMLFAFSNAEIKDKKTYHKMLAYVLYVARPESYYKTFEIPKRNGGTRQISAPTEQLKLLQTHFANYFSAKYVYLYANKDENINSNIAHGFIKERSIITNAKIHRNKRYVINVDLKDFFNQFHFGRVCGFFEKNKDFNYTHNVAVMAANLCCYNGCLPQGAPTSPILTNFICRIMDYKILKLAKEYRLDYTRYADDLTFSTNKKSFGEKEHFEKFINDLSVIVKHEGFEINEAKTVIHNKDSRQTVTGLVVNKDINVERKFYKKTRSMAYKLYTEGKFEIDGKPGTLKQLEGRFAFIDSVSKARNKADDTNNTQDEKHHLNNSRERDYRDFLFFTHFYANKKPVIVVEGKTDSRYIKAALKNLCQEYPNLVTKEKIIENGKVKEEFKYGISFLNRTKRLHYYFELNQDGADGLINLTNYFFCEGNNSHHSKKGNKESLNYYDYFKEISGKNAKYPVILLFDNEMVPSTQTTEDGKNKQIKKKQKQKRNGKPLYKYCNQYDLLNKFEKEEIIENIKAKQFSIINKESNLYVATFPLPEGKEEAEIENLFKPEWLNSQVINGKKIGSLSKNDWSKYSIKNGLSNYVMKNYQNIDFEGFRGLLDTLDATIKDYQPENPIKL